MSLLQFPSPTSSLWIEAQTPWRLRRPALGLTVSRACDTRPRQLLLGLRVGTSASRQAQTLVGGARGPEKSLSTVSDPSDSVILSMSTHRSTFRVVGHPKSGRGTLGAKERGVAHFLCPEPVWSSCLHGREPELGVGWGVAPTGGGEAGSEQVMKSW